MSAFKFTRDEDFRRTFERTNLAKVEAKMPDLLLGLVYRGFSTNIYGPTGSAKTLIAQGLVLEALRSGLSVGHWDEEMGKEVTAARYRQMGATDIELGRVAFYTWQRPTLDDGDAFVAQCLDDRVDLVLIDPTADFLSAAGMEENSNDDITAWAAAFPQALSQRGVASILLDGAPHGAAHQRGGIQKGYKASLVFGFDVREEPSKTNVGLVELECEKDRFGDIGRGARVTFRVGGDGNGQIVFRREEHMERPSAEDRVDKDREDWVRKITAVVQAHAPHRDSAITQSQLLTLLPAGKRKSDLIDLVKLAAAPGRAVMQAPGKTSRSVIYWYEEPVI